MGKVVAAADGNPKGNAVAYRKPPGKSDPTSAQGSLEASTSVRAEPNRVASKPGLDANGHSTQTERHEGGDRQEQGAAAANAPASADEPRVVGRDSTEVRLRLRLDASGSGAAADRQPGSSAGDRQGENRPSVAEAPASTAPAVQVASAVRLRPQRLEDPELGSEPFRDACETFSLGRESFAYVANWLTDYCWREASTAEARQSRSNRRKTLLFFAEPEDELAGFAAWRMREEQISGTDEWVGEVRFLAVIPRYRGRGVASQIWSTVRQAITTSEHGSETTVVRIEVDQANVKAREVYEQRWGFEYAYSHISGGKPYDVLLYRPGGETDADGAAHPAPSKPG